MDFMGYGVMRILVTGAQGYLGDYIVKILKQKNATVFATGRRHEEGIIACDLTRPEEVINLIKDTSPDCIVHCAAYVPKNLEEYSDSNNAKISLSMLDSVLEASKCPIVYISSMTVYGEITTHAVSEDEAGQATSEYGIAKWQGEELLKQDGRACLSIRIPGLFGLPRKTGLVFNLLNSIKNKQQLVLPEQPIVWAAIHVKDAAESIVKLAMSEITKSESLNIGYPGKYSINNLVEIAGNIFGEKIEYAVKQPVFEFNLERAIYYDALSSNTFEQALINFGNDI